jgi:hypothetical protein
VLVKPPHQWYTRSRLTDLLCVHGPMDPCTLWTTSLYSAPNAGKMLYHRLSTEWLVEHITTIDTQSRDAYKQTVSQLVLRLSTRYAMFVPIQQFLLPHTSILVLSDHATHTLCVLDYAQIIFKTVPPATTNVVGGSRIVSQTTTETTDQVCLFHSYAAGLRSLIPQLPMVLDFY